MLWYDIFSYTWSIVDSCAPAANISLMTRLHFATSGRLCLSSSAFMPLIAIEGMNNQTDISPFFPKHISETRIFLRIFPLYHAINHTHYPII
jgi:hypothetical protein